MLLKSDGTRENWWLTSKYKCESKGCPQLCGAHIIPQCYDRCKSSGSKHVDDQSNSTPYIKWVTIYGSKCYKTCQATIRRCQRIARNWDAHYKNLKIDFSQGKFWKKVGQEGDGHERTEYAKKASKKLAD